MGPQGKHPLTVNSIDSSVDSMTRDTSTPTPGIQKAWRVGLIAVAIAVGVAVACWGYFQPIPAEPVPEERPPEGLLPPDPRQSYVGPFHNVRPGVKYVGDATCAECHAEIARTYSQHPMGRSTVPIAQFSGRLPLDPAHHNPFEAFSIQFRVDVQGNRVSHHQARLTPEGKPIYEFAHEVNTVVGSGVNGHSYLTVQDGFVFQTPISWFSQKQIWDLSPGFPPWARAGRLIQGACLYCHANRVEPVEDTRNRYTEPVFRGHSIGCERCHGPGELHARSSQKDDIVDPKRLEPELREAVCQQCHLEGATRVLRRGRALNDFRPGMPLQEFLTVYVRGPGTGVESKAVSHVEQMCASLCFQRSPAGRKMGCTSCHNPHEAVAPIQRAGYFRNRCLQCHTRPATECRISEVERRKTNADDSCFTCHMPRSATTDIVHTASTDHRIIRLAKAEPDRPRPKRPNREVPLLDFHRGSPNLSDNGQARDLGVAMYQLTQNGFPLSERDGEFAVGLLDRALAECPGDKDALEAKGKILQTIQRPESAIAACETLLLRAPRHETALVTLGTIHRDLGRRAEAIDYWRRAVEVNPWVAEYRKNLATLLTGREAWDELRPHCCRWLELDPASVEARSLWVQCLLKEGKKPEAVAEYAKVQALEPPDIVKLNSWFLPQLR